MKLGAIWKPGKARDGAHGKQLVYYSTYQLNKSFGKDNKSARASGILVSDYKYYPVYYLGNRNMRWNEETEQLFRYQFEQSELGHGFPYGGNILLGETWELAERIVRHADNPRSRLIRFTAKDLFYYYTLDHSSIVLLHANVDGYYGYQLEYWLNKRCGCPLSSFPDYLFNLEATYAARSVVVLRRALYYYELRTGSLTQQYKGDLAERYEKLVDELKAWYRKANAR